MMLICSASELLDVYAGKRNGLECENTLSVGDKLIDALLEGGVRSGEVVELCGASTTGKTQMCIGAVVDAICSHADSSAVFITGSASHIEVRVRDLVSTRIVDAVSAWWSNGQAAPHLKSLNELLPRATLELRSNGNNGAPDDIEIYNRLTADVQSAVRRETELTLRQLHIVQVFDAAALLAALQALECVASGAKCAKNLSCSGGIFSGDAEPTDSREKPTPVTQAGVERIEASLRGPPLVALVSGASAVKQEAAGVAIPGRLSMLVVDGASALLGAALGGERKQFLGHAIMAEVGVMLHAIARSSGAAVLVTNSVTAARGGGVGADEDEVRTEPWLAAAMGSTLQRPSLGPSWSYVPDSTVLITRHDGDDGSGSTDRRPDSAPRRRATLLKSTRLCCGSRVELTPTV